MRVSMPDRPLTPLRSLCSLLFAGLLPLLAAGQDGAVDEDFAPVLRDPGIVRRMEVEPDGTIVVSGDFSYYQGQAASGVVRLAPTGAIVEAPRFQPPRGLRWVYCGRFSDGSYLVQEVGPDPESIFELRSELGILRRVGRDGQLDGSFTAIRVRGRVDDSVLPTQVAMQPSDTFVVLDRDRLAGYLPDGRPDPNFVVSEVARYIGIAGIFDFHPPPELFRLRDGRFLAQGIFRQETGGQQIERTGMLRLSANGIIDPTFQAELAVPLVEYPDGSLLVSSDYYHGNYYTDRRLQRLSRDGALERVLETTTGIRATALQPDGKILALANRDQAPTTSPLALIRLEADGAVDPSFMPDFGTPALVIDPYVAPRFTTPTSLLRLPGGRILVGGWFYQAAGQPASSLAFLEADGTAAAGAGSGVERGFTQIFRAALDRQGRLLVGGTFATVNGRLCPRLARLSVDGTLDESFRPEIQDLVSPSRFAVRSDGGIYLMETNHDYFSTVVRLDGSGKRMRSFTVDPYLFPSSDRIYDLAVTGDDQPLLCGDLDVGYRMGVVRLLAETGALDLGFFARGDRGRRNLFTPTSIVVTPGNELLCGGYGPYEKIRRLNADGRLLQRIGADLPYGPESIVPLPDGRLLLAYGGRGPQARRLLANGEIDPTFTAPRADFGGSLTSLHVQRDGRILLTGNFGSQGGRARPYAARLRENGIFDDSFNAGAGAAFAQPRAYAFPSVWASVLLPDDSLILAGDFQLFSGYPRSSFVKLRNASLPAAPPVSRGRLVNVSSRAAVGAGEQMVIGGFVLQGAGSRRIVLRALGPSLERFGVGGVLPNPRLRLCNSAGQTIAGNDQWADADVAALHAAGLEPTHPAESALVADLAAGAYTVLVDDPSGASGNVLVEAYDVSADGSARVVNFSTRAVARPLPAVDRPQDPSPLIGGFVIRGGGCKVLLRALGPSLSRFGLRQPSSDLRVKLRSADRFVEGDNDNWRDQQYGEDVALIEATPFAPGNDRECALLYDLPEGSYTLVVEPVAGNSADGVGVATVEIFEVP